MSAERCPVCDMITRSEAAAAAAEVANPAGQVDTLGPCCRGGQDDWRGRVEELAAVVLANAKDIQADVVGALDALEKLGQADGRTGGETGIVEGGGETIDSDLHLGGSYQLLRQANVASA